MGGGDWKDSGYRGLVGRTEDLRTSHTLKLQELGGYLMSVSVWFGINQTRSYKIRAPCEIMQNT